MIPVKICEFCSTRTMYVPLAIGTEYPSAISSRTLRVHYCKDCRAEYVYWSNDGALASIHLYATIGEKMYRWSMVSNIKGGRLWHVGEPGIPGEIPNKGLVLLKSLEDLNSITPSNVEEKIRTYLPFL